MKFGSIHVKKFKEGKTKIKTVKRANFFFNSIFNDNWINCLFSQWSTI